MNDIKSGNLIFHALNNLPFRLFGFGILMGCHFLILYSPIFGYVSNQGFLSSLNIYRQTLLNVGLACSFFLILLLSRKLPAHLLTEKNSRNLNYATSGILLLSIILSLLSAHFSIEIIYLLSITLIGASLGVLTYLWFHLYSETSVNYSFIYLSISMIIAGLVGFIGRYLSVEVTIVLFILFPILSALMYHSSYTGIKTRSQEFAERGVVDKHGALRPLISITLKLSMLSLIVGILQGLGTIKPGNYFSIDSPYAALGATLAGLIILLLTANMYYRYKLFNNNQLAIALFLISIVLLPFSEGSQLVLISSLIMFAYIYMDLQVLIQTLNLIRTFDVSSALLMGLNRSILYASFACGIVFSKFASNVLISFDRNRFILSTVCVIIIAVFLIVLDFIEFKPTFAKESLFAASEHGLNETHLKQTDDKNSNSPGTDDAIPTTPSGKIPFRFRIQHVAETYQLSPRETEVFFLIAKGRNAEYVQNALQISSHTAKSHISNIYKKLNVHSAQEMLDVLDELE